MYVYEPYDHSAPTCDPCRGVSKARRCSRESRNRRNKPDRSHNTHSIPLLQQLQPRQYLLLDLGPVDWDTVDRDKGVVDQGIVDSDFGSNHRRASSVDEEPIMVRDRGATRVRSGSQEDPAVVWRSAMSIAVSKDMCAHP